MKRTEKKKLVLTKHELRVLTKLELEQVPGASGHAGGGCGGGSPTCTNQK